MTDVSIAALLGLIEGFTEYLPVSSTGHLIIVGHLLGFSGQAAASFEIAIQLGAILAVALLYKDRFLGLMRTDPEHAFSGLRGLWLLFLTTLPAVIVGGLFHSAIKERLFAPLPVALAWAVGALALLWVEQRASAREGQERYADLDGVTPRLALGVGLAQCLSLWPGFSRAGATILGGMFLGAERKLAAEYSFLAAVPVMVAAAAYDLYKSREVLLAQADPLFWTVGFLVSFLSAYVAVKCFLHLLNRWTLRPFAYYRLALAPLVFLLWAT